MNQLRNRKRGLRKQPVIATAAGLAGTAGKDVRDMAAPPAADKQAGAEDSGVQDRLAQAGGAQFYTGPIIWRACSTINLAPDNSAAFLNEQGQAAVSSFIHSTTSCFDGDRLHDFGSPGETWIPRLRRRARGAGHQRAGQARPGRRGRQRRCARRASLAFRALGAAQAQAASAPVFGLAGPLILKQEREHVI